MTDQDIARQIPAAHGVAVDPDAAASCAALVVGLSASVRRAAVAHMTFEDEPSSFLRLLADSDGPQ